MVDRFLSSPPVHEPEHPRGYTTTLDKLTERLGAHRPLTAITPLAPTGALEQPRDLATTDDHYAVRQMAVAAIAADEAGPPSRPINGRYLECTFSQVPLTWAFSSWWVSMTERVGG